MAQLSSHLVPCAHIMLPPIIYHGAPTIYHIVPTVLPCYSILYNGTPDHTIPVQYVVSISVSKESPFKKVKSLFNLLLLLLLLFCFKINVFSVEIIFLSLYPTHSITITNRGLKLTYLSFFAKT